MTAEMPVPLAAPTGADVGKRPSRVRAALQQFLMAVTTLLIISFVAFVAMNRSADQVARNALGKGATSEQLDAYVASHGLDPSWSAMSTG